MDLNETRSFESTDHAFPALRAQVDYHGHAQGEVISVVFSLKQVSDDFGANAALMLAKHMLASAPYNSAVIHISDTLPYTVTVGPTCFSELKQALQWIEKSQWLSESLATEVIEFCNAMHKQSPRHKPITPDALCAGLQAFEDEVCSQVNVFRHQGERLGRIHHYNTLRTQLASKDALAKISQGPYYSMFFDDYEAELSTQIDGHLSIEMLEVALRRMSDKFTKSAKIQPLYGNKREYVGPRVMDQETGRMQDLYAPQDSNRKDYVKYVLKNVQGITYEESIIMLKGIEAFDKAVRQTAGIEGKTNLDPAFEALRVRKANGEFTPSRFSH